MLSYHRAANIIKGKVRHGSATRIAPLSVHLRIPASTQRQLAASRANAAPPSTPAEVVPWAQQQFLQEVSRPGDKISLAKACMLIALEEEATAQLETSQGNNRTSATASTWSLTRLDALAAEVVDALVGQNPQLGPQPLHHDGAPPPVDIDDLTKGQIPGSRCSLSIADNAAPTSSPPFRAAQAVQDYAQQYPMQALTAVNDVLFGRHGYSACNRYGTATDSHLSTVLESGPGSCAALTVLYMEVCSRLGMTLGFKVLEEGRYCLVWPKSDEQQQLLMAAGEACVVDVYGRGALLTVKEVSDLFDISEDDLFAGSSCRSLLAALLAEQQHAHWCTAVGCSPQPAFMTHLSAATAVNGQVKQLKGLSIERATTAARKRVALLPGDMGLQLQLALLCYFSGHYEDAWLELGSYIEAVRRLQTASGVSSSGKPEQPAGSPPGDKADPVSAATAAAASLTGAQEITAAAAASVSASAVTVTAESEADEDGELSDVLLLFEKLQLELMMGSARTR